MKASKIKPIPKYIEKLIYKIDKQRYPQPSGHTRFYAYFTKNDGELVKVTVAVKHRYKKWYCKQVAVHGIHSPICFAKDIAFYYIAGYVVDWFELTPTGIDERFVNTTWAAVEDKYFDPFAVPVNIDYVLKQTEFKYSAVNKIHSERILQYLRLYEEYPHAEYIIKLGLRHLAMSKQILRKAKKDKRFRKWLGQQRNKINMNHYVSSVLTAYATGKDIDAAQEFEESKKSLIKNHKNLYQLFKSNLEQFFNYLRKQNTSASSYEDYLIACNGINLDMSLEKNLFPHDFRYWHDIRIDQYATKRAIEDEQKRKELYAQFKLVAEKYLTLQRNRQEAYVVIIAQSPAELIKEGIALNHCVGRMNYDQRFVKEESLIFFVRNKDNPEKPLVTVEYSIPQHKVLQCYGDRDSRPQDEILDFVNKTWLPYANRKIRRIAS